MSLGRRSNQPQRSLTLESNPEQGPTSLNSVKVEGAKEAKEEKFEASRGWFMKSKEI